jgi:hypothetical protein
MNTDTIESSFWMRENAIDNFRNQVTRLNTHFADFGTNTFVINAAILGPDDTYESQEWQITGTGSPNPEDKDYSHEARIMTAIVTAAKRELQAICAEMLLQNRAILKQS